MSRQYSRLNLAARLCESGLPLVMGILNRTPDSFSDGGNYYDHEDPAQLERALTRAKVMIQQGARIIDVGGESTRPGSLPVSQEEELTRVLPVVRELVRGDQCWVSVDTQRAEVARLCLREGAHLINDVSAGERDSRMFDVVSEAGALYCAMHMKGRPENMQHDPRYDDVVDEVADYLRTRVSLLEQTGLARDHILLDPGIGFGKTLEHNLQLMAQLRHFSEGGYAVLLGASRKSFLQQLDGSPVDQRLGGSLAVALMAAAQGVRVIRVHDVQETVQALRVHYELVSRSM